MKTKISEAFSNQHILAEILEIHNFLDFICNDFPKANRHFSPIVRDGFIFGFLSVLLSNGNIELLRNVTSQFRIGLPLIFRSI